MRWLTKRAKDCRRPRSCDHTNVIVSPRESDGFTSIDFFARISSSITATIRSGVYRSIRPPSQRTPPTRRVHHDCNQQHLSEALSPATIYLSKIKSSLAIKGCSLITAPDLHLTESTRTSSFQRLRFQRLSSVQPLVRTTCLPERYLRLLAFSGLEYLPVAK